MLVAAPLHLSHEIRRIRELRNGTRGNERCRFESAHACIDQCVQQSQLLLRREELRFHLKSVAQTNFGDGDAWWIGAAHASFPFPVHALFVVVPDAAPVGSGRDKGPLLPDAIETPRLLAAGRLCGLPVLLDL